MEIFLPVRKVLNYVYSEDPNLCHGVSAPLGQGMEVLTSGSCQVCMQILGCSFLSLEILTFACKMLGMALRWDSYPVASGSTLSLFQLIKEWHPRIFPHLA